ncbi:MAG: crotonase/enoyl-CoA hydratase family protein [Betaproteobacteria bacterium]|nr:crotonase/enoyl-CoA hydratase family protein [Betaproteobacteria bacterium]
MDLPTHFKTLRLSAVDAIVCVELNRPDRANAINLPMWLEIREAFTWVDQTASVRVAVLRGAGKHFCSGIDLDMLSGISAEISDKCAGRQNEKLRRLILDLQDTLTSIERCRKPVLAAIHGACIGGGMDLICPCDMRYCSSDANFSVKEVDLGLTADVGTLQRLPRLIGEGMTRELAYTARNFNGSEAREMGLVNHCYTNPDRLHDEVMALARSIATKSPLAVRGSKEMISYARDHTVADGLNYVATWNSAMLLSADLDESITAARASRAPLYRD